MLPSILAKQLQQGLSDYIGTTFPMTNPSFQGSLERMLKTPDAVFHEPYAAVRLPFRVAEDEGDRFESIHSPFKPYVHQQKAFERLTGSDGRSTLIATGTGSGKTECFLYPILEYCYQHRGEKGIKAIIIYPMNALATDQAGRIAKLIYGSPELNGNVTVGMYVGGFDSASGRVMGEDSVITDRETMRSAPPDILMTNYKMLDYLLVRPGDAPLWEDNRPDTLKYIAVDELHTFDGAQGTDLACLLRRLKARLYTPQGYLCCIGTSATMGSKDSADGIREFAEKVFGEPFEKDAIVTEDRLSAMEFFAGYEPTDFTVPTQEQMEALNQLVNEDNERDYLNTAAKAWLTTAPAEDMTTPEARLALGKLLMSHSFCQNMLMLMDGNYMQASYIADELSTRYPQIKELIDPIAAVNALLALISHARIGTEDKLRPFLTVQIQLWFRELRRLVAKVAKGEGISYALSSDLNESQAKHYLPVVNCRDCGETGWVSLKNERGGVEITDIRTFYNLYFRCDSKVIMMFPHSREDNLPYNMARGDLCPECLHLNITENDTDECESCGSAKPIPIVFPIAQNTTGSKDNKQFVCPFCGSRRGLALMGVRSATAISASISQLFASQFNDDKKTLAFSDNVQDAAHHAGFFNARTWRFGLRSAIQRYAQNGGDGKSLEEFQNGFIDYWKSQWTTEEYVGRLIAPNMVWMKAYEDMTESGVFGTGRLEKKLLKDIEQRSKYEIMLEYGLSSRIGRTLEKSGCSTLAFDTAEIEKIAAVVQERVINEIGALTKTDISFFKRMVLGYVNIMRQNGAFDDRAFDIYSGTGQSFDLSNNQKTKRDWMPGVQTGRNTPRFIYVPSKPGQRIGAFDQVTSRKYTDWLSGCTDEFLIGEGVFDDVALIIFDELKKAGIIVQLPGNPDFTVWALSKKHIFVTTAVKQFVCDDCGTMMSVAAENADMWEDAPCTRLKCGGRMHDAPTVSLGYYGKLYSTGDMVRVVAQEHTGLLERADREKVEKIFKRSSTEQKPWDTNVLSCTPTLEMGIDIGDLSTVIMCSVPPAQSQFLQRAGRAGRTDGNALTITVANARPHDLYFYADPMDMIAGKVEPPTVFLQASAVLERQFVAYCMDCWIRHGIPEKAIPDKVKTCLAKIDKHSPDLFPFNFLQYVQNNLSSLIRTFVQMFSAQLDEDTIAELRTFAQGSRLQNSPMHMKIYEAFAGLKLQRDALAANIKQLTKMIKDLEAKPQDSSYDEEIRELKIERTALGNVVREINSKDIFNFLSDEGLLPNYAFPEAGIILKAILRRKDEESAIEEANEEKPRKQKYQKMVYEYSRSAASAISEFAPMNSFYVDGRKLTIDQVDLTTAQTELWRLCPNCSHAQQEVHGQAVAACPQCGSPAWADSGQLRSMLKVHMVYSNDDWKSSLIGDDSDDRSTVFYTKQMLVDVDEAHDISKAYRMDNDEFPFGYEFVRKATMREINFGESDMVGERLMVAGTEDVRKGFKICKHCGKIQPANGKPEHTYTCKAKNAPAGSDDPYEECLFLYREFATEALRILIPATTMDSTTVRLESFTAAFMLGMKERFGNVDHLRATVSEVPVADADYRKQYLVIYDSVPGGTGYLKQLMQRQDSLVDIFEKALRVLDNCTCKDDPQKDGCYHCLYAYRQSNQIGQISRKTAISLLKAIISGKDNIEEIPMLGNIPVNSLFESELERRFIEALDRIHTESGSLNPVKALVNGKEGYRMKVGDTVWEIEPQVVLDASSGVSVTSRADFVLWPVREAGNRKPVVIFTDGFQYHKDRVADDTLKREAILRSGRFRVWILSWKDVQSVFQAQGDYATQTLTPQSMPAGAQMYQPSVASWHAESLQTEKLSPMELLVKYLEMDEAEDLFTAHAKAYAFSLLEPKKRTDTHAFAAWKNIVDSITDALNSQTDTFVQNDTVFGTWVPRQNSSHVSIYSGVSASEMKAKKTNAEVSVFAALLDREDARTDKYEVEWNGYWQFFNVMQFLGSFSAVTANGLAQDIYDAIPVVTASGSTTAASGQAVSSVWEEDLEYIDDSAKAMADKLIAISAPAPSSVGYELEDSMGAGIAEAEMAWEEKKIVYLLPDQEEYRSIFENQGWAVITDTTEPAITIFEGRNS